MFRQGIVLIIAIALLAQFLSLPSNWLTSQKASQETLCFQVETRNSILSHELPRWTSKNESRNLTIGTRHNNQGIHDNYDSSSNSSSSNNNNNNNNNYSSSYSMNHESNQGSIAILHFGPRKTATTSIQTALTQFHTQTLLAKDSFVYLGRATGRRAMSIYQNMSRPHLEKCIFRIKHCNETNLQNCFYQENDSRCNETQIQWRNFIQHVEQERLHGKNIIISDEELYRFIAVSAQHMQQLLDVFANFTQIRVVFGYRPFFEWIPSEYNQEMKRNIRRMGKIGPVLAFCDWYAQQFYSAHPDRDFSIFDGAVLGRFQAIFPTIQVFNINEDDHDRNDDSSTPSLNGSHNKSSLSSSSSLSPTNSIMANFLCHMIPEAQHACEAARAGTLVTSKQDGFKINGSMDNLDAYLIAEQVAQKLNMINVTIQHIHSQLVPTIQKCLDDAVSSIKAAITTTTTTTSLNTTANDTSSTTRTTSSTSMILNSSTTSLPHTKGFSYPTIPKNCLSNEELERLLQKSLQMERDILSPPWYKKYPLQHPQLTTSDPPLDPKEPQQQHDEGQFFRSAFAKYVEQEKYCSVDFEQLWKNQEWRTVLEEAVQTTTTASQ
jgi:hypothetical protein